MDRNLDNDDSLINQSWTTYFQTSTVEKIIRQAFDKIIPAYYYYLFFYFYDSIFCGSLCLT